VEAGKQKPRRPKKRPDVRPEVGVVDRKLARLALLRLLERRPTRRLAQRPIDMHDVLDLVEVLGAQRDRLTAARPQHRREIHEQAPLPVLLLGGGYELVNLPARRNDPPATLPRRRLHVHARVAIHQTARDRLGEHQPEHPMDVPCAPVGQRVVVQLQQPGVARVGLRRLIPDPRKVRVDVVLVVAQRLTRQAQPMPAT